MSKKRKKEGPGKPSDQTLDLYKPKHLKNPVYWRRVQAEREVSLYLADTESSTYPKAQIDPLEWWEKISIYILMQLRWHESG